MRSRTKRFARRFRRAKREYLWLTVIAERVKITQGTNFDPYGVVLVRGLDWCRGDTSAGQPSNIQKGCTLLRSVGQISFFADPDTAADLRNFTRQTCYWAVKREDQDVVESLDLANGTAFEEEWMHFEQRQLFGFYDPTPTLATALGDFQVTMPFDMRVKRKLTTEDVVQLYVGAVPGAGLQTDVAFTSMFRTLIQLP